MRSILFLIILLTLNSCETTKQMKLNEKNKKQKKIMMDINTKPNITNIVKKLKFVKKSIIIVILRYIIKSGSQVIIAGNIIRTRIVKISAIKNIVTPLNTSVTGMSFLTPATTKQLRPIGGVIRQTSAIFTTIMPNHTLT